MTSLNPDDFATTATDLFIPTGRLRGIIHQLTPAWQRRTTIPVLGTVLLDAGPDGSTLCITDLDMLITVRADDLTTAAPFRACVPFGLLARIAASVDEGLRLTHLAGDGKTQMDRLRLDGDDGFNATINLLCPPEDFPSLSWIKPDTTAEYRADMQPADLLRHLRLSQHCISREETRYYLNGVYFCRKPDGDTLRAVTTDGHRMAVIDGATAWPEQATGIWPRLLIAALLATLDATANDLLRITVAPDQNRVTITAGALRIDARMIDGTFPDYTRVIPQEETRHTVILNMAGLRRLLPLAIYRQTAVAFTDGRASVTSVEVGEVSIPVQMTGGDCVEQKITGGGEPYTERQGFNLDYLMTQARVTPEFRLESASPLAPARIYGTDPDAIWVLMPMRV